MKGRLLWVRVASVASVLLCLAVGAGCGGFGGSAQGGEASEGGASGGGEVTVFAASSLTDAFEELAGTFEEQNGGSSVRLSFASSSDLLAQIQQGAPADVFAPAGQKQMDTAVQENLVAEPEVFARNRPVIIVPADNPAGIEGLRDLGKADATLVLAEEGVPIAQYAEEVLANADAEYGGGFARRVGDKIASREANVRAAANRVALGEADATFVYISDVTKDISDRVRVIEIPENLNVVATYPIAAAAEPKEPELARAWVDLVTSEEGQAVLEKYKFEPAAGS